MGNEDPERRQCISFVPPTARLTARIFVSHIFHIALVFTQRCHPRQSTNPKPFSFPVAVHEPYRRSADLVDFHYV